MLGSLAGTQQLQIEVVLPPNNKAQLNQLLHDLYDPSSPDYHHWLRPGQFAAQFGPSASEVASVQSWLHGAGLTTTYPSGFAVKVTAPASQVERSLGTSFERYRTRSGHEGYLAQQVPLIPQSLADGQVVAILGLDTLTTFQSDHTLARAPAALEHPAVQPAADGLTTCATAHSAAGTGYYTLNSLGADYGIGSLLSDGQNAHGQTVALYELASRSPSDVATYQSCFGLVNTVLGVTVDGGGGTIGGGGTEEADVDIEQVATQAPGTSIISYEGPNSSSGAYDTWNSIVTSDAAQVVSTSWGLCEPLSESAGFISSFATLFARAAAQGETVLTASGDAGSEGCSVSNSSTSLEVDYPSSDPWVTAVGGTDLLGPGDERAWVDSGGGISRYVPDPSWQPIDWHWVQAGNPCGLDCREVPDISTNAGVGMIVYENGVWAPVGGTSLAAPFMAGLVADRNDGCASPTADLAPTLYAASAQGLYGSGLTDITSGNNDASGTYGGTYYPASPGYDPVTGLGSPLTAGLSCAEVVSVSGGTVGSQVTVTGLGLEHATINFGGHAAQVVSATATSATVVVPGGTGTVVVQATSLLGAGTQSVPFTYGPTVPPFPTSSQIGAYPSWIPANLQVSNVDHSEGSDTTLFMMQTIGDIYTGAGLFPFSCALTSNLQNCLTPAGNGGNNPNNTQSDTVDNFAATEILNGVNNVGSGNGQAELCGTSGIPVGTTVDFSRSSKPKGSACTTLVQLGYAKDSVPAVVFDSIDPEAYGTPTGYNAIGHFISYNQATGATITTNFPSGGIGPVAAGWLPGDAYNCVGNDTGQSGPQCSGTDFNDIGNGGNGDGNSGLESVAFRLWCQHGSSTTAEESQIMDWGNLTNLAGGTLPVGDGAPIGVPIRIIGVNGGSGTAATFNNFALSGQPATTNCGTAPGSTAGNYNENAASGANPQVNQGPAPANLETALENDASQIGDFANANWGATDAADQATDIATSIYYMGNGPYTANPFSATASLEVNPGVVTGGLPTSFVESEAFLNGVQPGVADELNNSYPTARTLFNIYRTDTVKASTAGFLNWICDANPSTSTSAPTYTTGGQIQKGVDHQNGLNYDNVLTQVINGQYFFARLTDASPELTKASQVTENGVTNPNASCDAQAAIASGGITSGSNVVTLTAAPNANIQVGWEVATAAGFLDNIPYPKTSGGVTTVPATTITAIGPGNTLTLSNAVATGTGSVAPGTLYFPGHPPILGVASANLGS